MLFYHNLNYLLIKELKYIFLNKNSKPIKSNSD